MYNVCTIQYIYKYEYIDLFNNSNNRKLRDV
jgi:hypothetical protein